jgi:DNA-binding NarL/FixJ family response regulator
MINFDSDVGTGRAPDRNLSPDQPTGVTLLLADADVTARSAMRYALERHGFSVVAEVDNADEAFAAAIFHEPQMCLIDAGLPGGAISAADDIHNALSGTKIAMLSSTPYAGALYEAVRAGADGYLLRRTAPDRLAAALHAMLHGEAALPRALTGALLRELRNGGSAPGGNGVAAGTSQSDHGARGGSRPNGSSLTNGAGSIDADGGPDLRASPVSHSSGAARASRAARVWIRPPTREQSSPAIVALLYVPRLVRHFRRRRQSGMSVTEAWVSARARMMEYR